MDTLKKDHSKIETLERERNSALKIIHVQYQEPLNLIVVRGSSIADHSSHKYEQIGSDIEKHFSTNNSLHLYFNYDYLDNSALSYLATIIATLNEYHSRGKTVKLFWSCLSVADNMEDEGEKLRSLCEFDFFQ